MYILQAFGKLAGPRITQSSKRLTCHNVIAAVAQPSSSQQATPQPAPGPPAPLPGAVAGHPGPSMDGPGAAGSHPGTVGDRPGPSMNGRGAAGGRSGAVGDRPHSPGQYLASGLQQLTDALQVLPASVAEALIRYADTTNEALLSAERERRLLARSLATAQSQLAGIPQLQVCCALLSAAKRQDMP